MYLLLFACICIAGSSFAASIYLDNDGGTGTNPHIQMFSIPLVQAEYTDYNEVVVDFLTDFGKVNVTITDEYGRVYNVALVETSTQANLVIDTSSLAPGEYILKVKNESGTLSKSGRFIIN